MQSAASFSHLEAFIFDLDGVIWKGNAPIEGAVESVARLRAAGKRVFYCTNNSRRSPSEFAETLRFIGIECEDEDVMTSSTATSLYLQSLFTGPYTAYVIGEEGLIQTIRRTGAIVMTSPVVPQRSDMHDNHGSVDCVIVGLDATFTYHKLRVAQRLVMSGARFIATNRDATFPTPYGLVPGAGSVVAAVETATGVTPVTLGKPQPFMAHLLMQKFGLKPETTCMIGDRLDTDIVAARRAHITSILVTTGVHSREVGERAKGLQKPDAIFDDMPSLCDAIFADGQSAAASDFRDAIYGGGATAGVIGANVVAADAGQHEPESALHTPFAKETVESGGEEVLDFPPLEVTEEPPVTEDAEAETEGTGEPETVFADAPLPIVESAAEPAAATAGGADFFSFDDEKPAGEPAAPAAAAAAEEPVAFDFNMSFADEVASASADPQDPPAEDTGPTPEAINATDEEVAAAAKGEDKWWESLDNI